MCLCCCWCDVRYYSLKDTAAASRIGSMLAGVRGLLPNESTLNGNSSYKNRIGKPAAPASDRGPGSAIACGIWRYAYNHTILHMAT